MEDSDESPRVLSIQSHVVSGYVGNKAATFPLQTLGFQVDAVNTVQFSNHTGYGYTNGHKTTAEELKAIFQGLTTNGLINHTHILTGYIPGAEALQAVADQVALMRKANPRLVYVLDPVMGDIGRGLYVSEQVVPIYRDLLHHATVITPNHFELELLSQIKITSLSTLHDAFCRLHTAHSLPNIVLSSISLPDNLVRSLGLPNPPEQYTSLVPSPPPIGYQPVTHPSHSIQADDRETLVCFASSCQESQDHPETWAFALPTVHGYFSGVGDLFSALVLAHLSRTESGAGQTPAIVQAASHALLKVQQILLRTQVHSLSSAVPTKANDKTGRDDSSLPSDDELDSIPPEPGHPTRRARRMRLRELRIIEDRSFLLDNESTWAGRRVDWIKSLDVP